MRRRTLMILAASLAALTSACASSDSSTPDSTSAPRRDAPSETVTISDFKFDPDELTVPVGATVIWTNQDSFRHTATSGDFSGATNVADGTFDLDLPKQGTSAEFTFLKTGTYTYFCSQHNVMNASIVVEEKRGEV